MKVAMTIRYKISFPSRQQYRGLSQCSSIQAFPIIIIIIFIVIITIVNFAYQQLLEISRK